MKRLAKHRRRTAWRTAAGMDVLEPRTLMDADALEFAPAPVSPMLLDAETAAGIAEGEGELVADFSLVDVNPNSARYGENVSPRDYLGSLSGFYFGHAT